MIVFQEVSKKYDSLTALYPTELQVESGKTTALIGSSGCGKSTILRLIVGLIEPTTGIIKVGGQPITPANYLNIRRRIGYVIQDGGLFPHLTAEQNVCLMWRHLKQPETKMRLRLKELCDLTHFPENGLDRYPAELSGGQRQRVSLMRALMLDPQVLLLDEPLGALDPLVRARLQTDLKTIFQHLRKTVVLVTHDMAEAGYLSDTIVLMQEGRVVQQGTLNDLRDHPTNSFVSEFINAQRSLVML